MFLKENQEREQNWWGNFRHPPSTPSYLYLTRSAWVDLPFQQANSTWFACLIFFFNIDIYVYISIFNIDIDIIIIYIRIFSRLQICLKNPCLNCCFIVMLYCHNKYVGRIFILIMTNQFTRTSLNSCSKGVHRLTVTGIIEIFRGLFEHAFNLSSINKQTVLRFL